MNLLDIILVKAAKLITFLLRFLRLGSGTALPGLFVEKYYPQLITKLSKNFNKIILISGTNGKTTTQKALVKLLQTNDLQVISNVSGANLIRAIAAVLMQNTNSLGKVTKQVAVFEVEEATMPRLARLINPNLIILTNLFRDQLDAYGELEKTKEYLRIACNLAEDATVIINWDDPKLRELSQEIGNKIQFYSLGSYAKQFRYEGTNVSVQPKKGTLVKLHAIKVLPDLTTRITLSIAGIKKQLKFLPPGIYNVYNCIAALTASELLGLNQTKTIKALEKLKPPFGRGEALIVDNLIFKIFLIKNPAGFNQILQTLAHLKDLLLIIALNDKIADGRDVSWIWDSNVELLSGKVKQIVFTGIRALDMAVRFKYAGYDAKNLNYELDYQIAIEQQLSQVHKSQKYIYVLATYTAMNEIRQYFSKYIKLSKIYK